MDEKRRKDDDENSNFNPKTQTSSKLQAPGSREISSTTTKTKSDLQWPFGVWNLELSGAWCLVVGVSIVGVCDH